MRYLVVNADDFGSCAGVNRGIMEAHRRGIVTSASLMGECRAARRQPACTHSSSASPGSWAVRRRIWTRTTNVHTRPRLLPHFKEAAERYGVPLRGCSGVQYLLPLLRAVGGRARSGPNERAASAPRSGELSGWQAPTLPASASADDAPLYILGLVRASKWWRFERSDADRRMIERVVNEVELPGEFLVVPLGDDNKRLRKRLKRVGGAFVFGR